MKSTRKLEIINNQLVLSDESYSPAQRDAQLKEQKINIVGLDKRHLASRLYCNLCKYEVQGEEIIGLLTWFSDFKLSSYNWKNLDIDLSGDFFDPSNYDDLNRTYERHDVLTAYECVNKLRQDLAYAQLVVDEALKELHQFLGRNDFKFCKSSEKIELNFPPEIQFDELIQITNKLKSISLKGYVQSAKTYGFTRPAYILIDNSFAEIIINIRNFNSSVTEQPRITNN